MLLPCYSFTMSLIWIFITIGGIIGGYIPVLFGANGFSPVSVLTATAGSIIGIIVYKKAGL